MTTHEVISNDKDKGFHQKLAPAVEQVIVETDWLIIYKIWLILEINKS